MSTSVVVGPHRQQQPQQSRRVSVAMFFTIFAVSLLMEIHISGLLPTAGQLGFENDAVTTSTTTSVRTTTQSTTTTLLLSFSSSLTTHHNSASSSATTIHHCAEEEMRSFACHHHPASTWSKAVHVLQSPWLFIHNNDDSCHSSTCVLVRLVRYVAFQNAAVALVQHLKVQGVPVEIEYEDDASLVFSDKQEALSFAELVQSVASEECWSLIQRYFQVQQNDKNEPQEMAWLLSFPGSGGSFAVMTFENSLNVTAGSNFVADDKMVPVYNSMPNGPFLLHPERSVPKVILVKTHCAGYCVDCHVNDRSMMLSFTDFEKTCRRTFPPTGGSSNKDDSEFYYPNTLPSKIIHWYRDLSGVLIARKHKGLKKILAQNETTVNGTIIIRDTREGFLEWCKHIDSRFNIDEASFPESIHQSLFKQVPCSSDVYRWVKWHNHATELRDRIGVDTVKLYFEDFAEKWHDWGTKTLLGFLNGKHDVIRQRRTPPTDPARRYKSLYTKDETKALTKLVYALSSPECWADISLYFDEQLIQEDEKPGGLPARLPRRDDLPVRLAWLLSFPNSGTSYTMTNTEFLTNHSVLTNYPEEAKGPQLDLGLPFVLHLGLERPDVFLTKSHCNPKDDFYRFEKGCRTVRTNVNGTQTDSMYPSRAVDRIVHLVRSPFSNIAARMHLGTNKYGEDTETSKFSNTVEGLHKWCKYIDSRFGSFGEGSWWLTSKAQRLRKKVPCYSDVIHYVVWHNLAIAVANHHRLPVYYLHYESYASNYSDTVKTLYDFLGLPIVSEPRPFVTGKTYDHLYSAEEAQSMAELAKEIASPDCWKLIRDYFRPWVSNETMQVKTGSSSRTWEPI